MKRIKQILMNDMSRMFIQTNPCAKYSYENCFSIGEVSQSRDEPTVIEYPNGKGGFEEATVTRGSLSRVTTDLRAYDRIQYVSSLEDIFKDDCKVNLQIHFGECATPTDFNSFDKVVVLTDAYPTDFSKTTLLAANSSEREPVASTLGISAKEFYTIVNTTYSADILDYQGPIVSLDTQAAGTCPNCACSVTGKDIIVALQLRDSLCEDPSGIVAVLWMLYSFDGGLTFEAIEIDDINISQEVEPIVCAPFYFNESPNIRLDGNLIVITAANGQSIVYDLNTLFSDGSLDIISYSGRIGAFDYAVYDSVICNGETYFVGQLGNVWKVNNVDGSYQQILLDDYPLSDLYSIDCVDGNFIIGGAEGIWVGTGLNGKWVDTQLKDVLNVDISEDRYLVATSDTVYSSCDCSQAFIKKWTVPYGYCIKDINFYNDSIGFMILNNSINGPIVYRTIDGGNSFSKAYATTIQNSFVFMEISAASPNSFYAVGLNDTNGNMEDVCYTDTQWVATTFTGTFLQSELR